jgi:hypothetical protein
MKYSPKEKLRGNKELVFLPSHVFKLRLEEFIEVT